MPKFKWDILSHFQTICLPKWTQKCCQMRLFQGIFIHCVGIHFSSNDPKIEYKTGRSILQKKCICQVFECVCGPSPSILTKIAVFVRDLEKHVWHLFFTFLYSATEVNLKCMKGGLVLLLHNFESQYADCDASF